MLDLGAVVIVPFMLFVKYPAVRQAEFPTPLVIAPEADEGIPLVFRSLCRCIGGLVAAFLFRHTEFTCGSIFCTHSKIAPSLIVLLRGA